MCTKRTLASIVLGGLAWTGLGAPALANETGSLLVYPCFDNRFGATTVLTVVNTHASGSIAVEFVYIDGNSCLEFNRSVVLTAKDSFSAVTRAHFPDIAEGYVYAFAKNAVTGEAVSWDHLAGSLNLFSGVNQLGFKVQPYVFKSASGVDMALTDLDTDLVRDLNGVEYAPAPDTIVVPHFFGNGNLFSMNVSGQLVLLGLSGIQFRTLVDFAIYNDNEELFSTQVEFDCWDRIPLSRIGSAFRDGYLRSSHHDPQETLGLNEKTGWYEMDGRTASSTADQIDDPAFLALQIETTGFFRHTAAALPFVKGTQLNGDLLPVGILADIDETTPVITTLFGGGLFGGGLYTINRVNGLMTFVGDMSFEQAEGLAMDTNTNTIYGTDIFQDQLFRIDPATGSGVLVGSLGFDQVRGLAFDPNTNTLYGGDSMTDQLITIDVTTGAGTAVGALGFDGVRGLAFDASTGTLYAHNSSANMLYTIDTTTGSSTPVGALGFRSPRGLAYDPGSGKLFATDNTNLYAVDAATGAGTLVGPAVGVPPDRIGGLAVGIP